MDRPCASVSAKPITLTSTPSRHRAAVAIIACILVPWGVHHRCIAVQRMGEDAGFRWPGHILRKRAEHMRRPHHDPTLAGRALQAAHIQVLADRATQARLFQPDHIRCRADHVGIHYAHVLEEHAQFGQRDGRHRIALSAYTWLQGQARTVDETTGSAHRRDRSMRVVHLRIGLPDLRP